MVFTACHSICEPKFSYLCFGSDLVMELISRQISGNTKKENLKVIIT
jgi:hypothetical protein